MSFRVFSNPDPDNDTLVIQFDDDAMYVIHHGSAVMDPFPEGTVDFDWIELTGPSRAMADALVSAAKSPAVDKRDTQPVNVVIAPLGNGRYSVAVGDGPPLEVTRWYQLEADHYVSGDRFTRLYFGSKSAAEAYVAAGNPGTVHEVYEGRLVVVEWELPNGGCVADLSDVIDYYLRTITLLPQFFAYSRP